MANLKAKFRINLSTQLFFKPVFSGTAKEYLENSGYSVIIMTPTSGVAKDSEGKEINFDIK